MNDLIPLRSMQAGESAEIAEIIGDPTCRQRLHDLGLAHGTRFRVIRQGDPCIIRFSGTKLCFRQNESTSVMVKVPATI